MSKRDWTGDWTADPNTGASNSSLAYNHLVREVERMILDSSYDLIHGNTAAVARLIVSQLAHEHGLTPR